MLGIPRGYQAQDGKVTMEELYEALKDHLDQVPEDLGDRLGTGWGPAGHLGEVGDRLGTVGTDQFLGISRKMSIKIVDNFGFIGILMADFSPRWVLHKKNIAAVSDMVLRACGTHKRTHLCMQTKTKR